MDIIFLDEIRCTCVIGVWEWEKAIEQNLLLDIQLGTDIRPAAASDKLEDTLNYKQVANRVIDFAAENQFELIETMVERVAELIMQEFGIKWVKVRLNKGGAVKNVTSVGIEIERGERF